MPSSISRRSLLAALPAGVLATRAAAWAGPAPERSTLTAPDGHDIPLFRWAARAPRIGIVSFSHGAQSTPLRYPDMIGAWVGAGYDVVAPLHVDSPDHPDHARYPGLAVWKARIEDMRAVSDLIGASHIAAGHSFGALGALVQGGASASRPEGIEGPLRDPRAICVVAFSPPPPIPGLIEAAGYATLATPALIETGTKDVLPGPSSTPDSWHQHLTAYDAAAAGGHRYALVLDGANHYFGGAICDYSQPGPPQLDQLKIAIRLSLTFMAAWGGGQALARLALDAARRDAGPYSLAQK